MESLNEAVYKNDPTLLHTILYAENVTGDDIAEALCIACEVGFTDCATVLIEAGADVNRRCGHDMSTPLMKAVGIDNTQCISVLVRAGADVNVSDVNNNVTALIYATSMNFWESVKRLVDLGADVNKCDNRKRPALIYAVRSGHVKCLQILLAAGTHTCYRGDAIIAASQLSRLPCMELLLKYEIPSDCINKVLHLVAGEGKTDSLKLLLQNGANSNATNEHAETPLMKAAVNGHVKSVEVLLHNGASVNTMDTYNCTSLHKAADWGRTDCCQLLIEAGANVNASTRIPSKLTALLIAADKGYSKCLSLLLTAGADVNKSDIYKRTPLSLAARYDHFACVSVLLKSQALVNQYDMYGYNSIETHINYRRTANTEIVMVLWAAGEIIDSSRVDIPPCLKYNGIRSLKQYCREAIRGHLFSSNPHINLFDRVPKLPLPEILISYLLFDISLDLNLNNLQY